MPLLPVNLMYEYTPNLTLSFYNRIMFRFGELNFRVEHMQNSILLASKSSVLFHHAGYELSVYKELTFSLLKCYPKIFQGVSILNQTQAWPTMNCLCPLLYDTSSAVSAPSKYTEGQIRCGSILMSDAGMPLSS